MPWREGEMSLLIDTATDPAYNHSALLQPDEGL